MKETDEKAKKVRCVVGRLQKIVYWVTYHSDT